MQRIGAMSKRPKRAPASKPKTLACSTFPFGDRDAFSCELKAVKMC
jgi:hypothetical protein